MHLKYNTMGFDALYVPVDGRAQRALGHVLHRDRQREDTQSYVIDVQIFIISHQNIFQAAEC